MRLILKEWHKLYKIMFNTLLTKFLKVKLLYWSAKDLHLELHWIPAEMDLVAVLYLLTLKLLQQRKPRKRRQAKLLYSKLNQDAVDFFKPLQIKLKLKKLQRSKCIILIPLMMKKSTQINYNHKKKKRRRPFLLPPSRRKRRISENSAMAKPF